MDSGELIKMLEKDAHSFWKDKGVTGKGLLEQLSDITSKLLKAKGKRVRELIALHTSLLKSICYEEGIKWSSMGLNEHRFVDYLPEPQTLTRAEPPPPEPEDKPTGDIDPKKLEKEYKKAELAEQLAEMKKKFDDMEKKLSEQHPDPDANEEPPPEEKPQEA